MEQERSENVVKPTRRRWVSLLLGILLVWLHDLVYWKVPISTINKGNKYGTSKR